MVVKPKLAVKSRTANKPRRAVKSKTKNRSGQSEFTQRMKLEEKLRQSEEKYRTILVNMQEGYFEVDLAGHITFCNNSMCRFFGYAPEEMIGIHNSQFTDKKNAEKLSRAFNEVHKTGEPTKEFDWQIIRKDGTKRFLEASISLKQDSTGQPSGFQGK